MPDGGEAAVWSITVPPSTNNLYASAGNRRLKTPAYDRWLEEAGWELRAQLARPIVGKTFGLTIAVPLTRRRDLDNIAKPICDLLVSLGLMRDDRWVDDIHLMRLSEGNQAWIKLRALS